MKDRGECGGGAGDGTEVEGMAEMWQDASSSPGSDKSHLQGSSPSVMGAAASGHQPAG